MTFSVGGLSAINAIGGAYAENLPVILVSGAPNSNDRATEHLIHHTLATHDWSYQLEIAKKLTCAGAVMDFDLDRVSVIVEDGRGRGLRATSGRELEEAIEVAVVNRDGPTLIECVIDRDDCSADLISWGRQVAKANARPPRPQ